MDIDRSISLKEFIWNKERATLTIKNATLCDGHHWQNGNKITVRSHITSKSYIFQWDGNYHNDVWKLYPIDGSCPIRVIYSLDFKLHHLFDKQEPFVEGVTK